MTHPSNPSRPILPIPAALKGADFGSFAHNTVVVRLPEIARRVLADNDFTPDIVSELQKLISEIPSSMIRPLTDTNAPDTSAWQIYVSPYLKHNWLDVPWFFAETYFYRRIIEATSYFEQMDGRDPFIKQKQLGLESTLPTIRALCEQLQGWLDQGWNLEIFGRILSVDLWGNQADLSLWPAGEESQPNHTDIDQQQAHLLVDDTTKVTAQLENTNRNERVDFLVDNAGFELVGDLCLVDYLISTGKIQNVRFNLKIHPTFVSDAIRTDVVNTITYLGSDEVESVRGLAERLKDHLENGRLQLHSHPFWTSPLAAWEMPLELRQNLASASLIISKGDANYRRLLGDRHWSFTSPFNDIVSYLPAPLVALRTFKSEVAAGLKTRQLAEVKQKDPYWITNGRWGVVQYADSAY